MRSWHRVELRVIHMKGVVMTLEPVAIIEVEGQGIVHRTGAKCPIGPSYQTQDVCKEPCRLFLVVCRDNSMVQCDDSYNTSRA